MFEKACKRGKYAYWTEMDSLVQRMHSPNMTLQQFNTHIILSRGALYDLIFNSSERFG